LKSIQTKRREKQDVSSLRTSIHHNIQPCNFLPRVWNHLCGEES
jgi:hypothetical protein